MANRPGQEATIAVTGTNTGRWRAYWQERRAALVISIVILVVIGVVLALHRVAAVVYLDCAVALVVPVAILVGLDLQHFNTTMAQLAAQQDHAATAPLPPVGTPLAQAYRGVALALQRQLVTQQDTTQKQQTETRETLQLWTHQIKTPLTALDLLLQVQPVEASAARSEVANTQRYLEMILTYLKIADVNTDLVLTELPLTPLVQQTVRRLSRWFIAKDLHVEVEPLPTVVGDAQWLGFIFEQVLTNAAKYTDRGGIRVFAQGDAVVVADTGIGILPQDLPRLFDRGYSGYNGRANQKATGLGLYLSQQIATRLGLHLSVTSTVGQGTQVALHFPQTRWQADQAFKPVSNAPSL